MVMKRLGVRCDKVMREKCLKNDIIVSRYGKMILKLSEKMLKKQSDMK